MRILLTAATTFEVAPTVSWLREQARRTEANVLYFDQVEIEVLFTGVGLTATSFALGHRFGGGELPQLAVQAGVGGAIDRTLQLGEVVRISTETFGDLGAEDASGQPLTLSDIGLPPGPPFSEDGRLEPGTGPQLPFRACAGLTVNQVSGHAETIKKRTALFPYAQVESMEGAAFFYACQQAGVEPLQLRAISNYVTPRNREAWRMGEAIQSLNQALQQLLQPFIQREAV
jgi:futalosine hydrolase